MILYDSGEYQLAFIFRVDGSTLPKAAAFAMPSVVLCLANRYIVGAAVIEDWDYLSPKSAVVGFIWTVTFFTLSFLIGFRCNKAYARFWDGCTLVQTMSAEWFESCSNLIAFSGVAMKRTPDNLFVEQKVKAFQFILIRLMSLLHGVALRQIGGHDGEEFEVLDVYGLDDASLDYLTCDCSQFEINRAEVVLHWIQVLITESIDNGVMVIPAPILTRSYQTLSRGMVNLHRVRMIADIPFPFPLSQALVVLLLVQSILTPLIISFFFTNFVWSAVVCFMPLFGMWTLMFICGELEQPFGQDANDLPLTMQQFDFNNSLLMLVDDSSNQVPYLLEDAPVEADDLRDMFGDLESTTEVLYRCEQGIVTFRDFLRDNQQKRERDKAGNVNEAMSRIKGENLVSSDSDMQAMRNEARKRTNTRKATLKSNGSANGVGTDEIKRFSFKTRSSSKDLRVASRENLHRSGSRLSAGTEKSGRSQDSAAKAQDRVLNKLVPNGSLDVEVTVDGAPLGSVLTVSRAGSMSSLASSIASLHKRKGEGATAQGIPEDQPHEPPPEETPSPQQQWTVSPTGTSNSLPLPEQNSELLAKMQDAQKNSLTKNGSSASLRSESSSRAPARPPETAPPGKRSCQGASTSSIRNRSSGAATDRSGTGSDGSGGSSGSRRKRMAAALEQAHQASVLASVPSGAELDLQSNKSYAGSQGSQRSLPNSDQGAPTQTEELSGGSRPSCTALGIESSGGEPDRQVSDDGLHQGGPQFPKQSWSASPPRAWALAPMPPEHAPPPET